MEMNLATLLVFYAVLAITSIVSIIAIAHKRFILLSAILVTMVVFMLASTVKTYYAVMGYPAGGSPTVKSLIVSYIVDKPNSIFIWVVNADGSSKEPRAWSIPYEKNLEKQLANLSEKASNSAREVGIMWNPTDRTGTEMNRGEFVEYDFAEQRLPRK